MPGRPDQLELIAPSGTYDSLSSLMDQPLGSTRTKSRVGVSRNVDRPNALNVSVQSREASGALKTILFTVDSRDQFDDLRANILPSGSVVPRDIEVPSMGEILREIRELRAKQPSVRRPFAPYSRSYSR